MSKQMAFGAGGGLVEYKLRVDVSEAVEGFRELEEVVLRYLVIARRIGLPDNAEAAIQKIMQFIVAVRTLDITLKMFQAELGPIGWATLAASATITGLSFYEVGRPRY